MTTFIMTSNSLASSILRYKACVCSLRRVEAHRSQILMTGLTAFDNELHASNLHATAILAQHGSDDDNVPVEHSRRLVEVTNAWSEKPIARYAFFTLHSTSQINRTDSSNGPRRITGGRPFFATSTSSASFATVSLL